MDDPLGLAMCTDKDKDKGTGGDTKNPHARTLIDALKDADIIDKRNPITDKMEPYMKQYQINDGYKILLRRDFGDFNTHDPAGNHWNLEVQTIGGRTVYDLHIYILMNWAI